MYYGSSLDVTNSNFRPRATVGTAFTLDGDYTVEFWATLILLLVKDLTSYNMILMQDKLDGVVLTVELLDSF